MNVLHKELLNEARAIFGIDSLSSNTLKTVTAGFPSQNAANEAGSRLAI
jgi:hypothetical protein